MAKQLIVNQTLAECRAALIENGEILDFLMERGLGSPTLCERLVDDKLFSHVKILLNLKSRLV
jgi:hypothetical protein